MKSTLKSILFSLMCVALLLSVPLHAEANQETPIIALNSSSLSFTTVKGINPANQTITVSNTGGGTLNWTATLDGNATRSSVSPASGTGDSTLTVSINSASLAPGTYRSKIYISDPGAANGTQTVYVTLTISEFSPGIAAIVPNFTNLYFYSVAGTNPPDGMIEISTNGVETLNWTATADGAEPAWLSVSQASGTGNATLNVSVNSAGLAEGIYTKTITITAPNAVNSPRVINVKLTVSPHLPTITAEAGPFTVTGSSPRDHFFITADGTYMVEHYIPIRITAGTKYMSTFQISSSTSGPLNLIATVDNDAPAWLTISPTSVTMPGGSEDGYFSFSTDTTGLPAGTYTKTITITAQGTSTFPAVIKVKLTVVDPLLPPTLALDYDNFYFYSDAGASHTADWLSITNMGGGTLNWTATVDGDSPAWLSAYSMFGGSRTLASGKSSDLGASVNTTGLAAGTYTKTITITAPEAANSPQVLHVTLEMKALPAISLSSTALSFTVAGTTSGGYAVLVSNSGGGTLNWTATADAASPAWLSLSPASGKENALVRVSANSAGLSPGTYTKSITISAPGATNSPQTMDVTLTVRTATIALNPSALSFTTVQGINPANKTIALANSENETPLSGWNVSADTTSPDWLMVVPNSGSGNVSITASVNSANLLPGTYTKTITVSAPGATNSPQTVNVTLTVSALSTIALTPSALSFTAVQGTNPANRTIALSNIGGGTLNWTATANATSPAWLSVSPTSGAGDATLTASVNSAGLLPGTYKKTITVFASGATNSPQTVDVTLTVKPENIVFATNAGGGQYINQSAIVYQADINFSGGYSASTTAAISGTSDDTLYQSERYGNFSYNIPLANGNYTVTLKFAEIYWDLAGRRVFNVSMQGNQVISNLDIFAKVGKNAAYDVDVPVSVANGSLKINFTSVRDYAKVSAIVITSNVTGQNVFNCPSADVTCLIDAINESNAEPGEHTINLASGTYSLSGVNNTADGSNGLPSITGSIKIVGAGMDETIIARDISSAYFRLFHIAESGKLSLEGLTVTGGFHNDFSISGHSTGGGGIYNRGTLDVIACKISNNIDEAGVYTGRGGGIYNNSGAVTIQNSILSGNRGRGGAGSGGALWSNGGLVIENTVFIDNTGGYAGPEDSGGAIFSLGSLVIKNSTFIQNHGASSLGGAINVAGTADISNSSFVSNWAYYGGAIYIYKTADVTISNSTFYSNEAATRGGGIYNDGTLSVTNSTFYKNDGNGGGIYNNSSETGTVQIQNTIMAGNTESTGWTSNDCNGSFISLGNNLIGNTSGCSITLQPTDKTGDPKFDAFIDSGLPEGGYVPLLADSPAIDAGDNAVCQSLQTDQIGNPRIIDGNGDGSAVCDIGAVEYLQPASIVVFATNSGGGQYTDQTEIIYQADTGYSGGYSASTAAAITGTSDDTLYQSERYGNFSYNIPLANGDYTVTLKFAEIYWDAPGRRVFNVIMQGNQVISNLDIFSKVGKNAAYDVTIPVSVTNGTLNINFSSIADYAKVSAIEINGQMTPPPTPSDTVVLATNSGGNAYTSLSGVEYQEDTKYSGGDTSWTTAAISGTSDDALYQTERFGNFSYNIPLENGNYTVTLRFAEIYWTVAGKRVFNVNMQGTQVINNLDIFSKVGKNAAYDVTIPVSVKNGTLNIKFSSIADYAKVSAIEVIGPE